jgi:hypothetical protein
MPALNGWWYGAGAACAVAVVSGVADWRRRHRDDLDAVGPLHWPTVQMLALLVVLVCGAVAVHG